MKITKCASLLSGGSPTEEQLALINRFSKTPLEAEQVYCFSVRLCDDGPDRDFERFDTAALPALAELFVGKTGILDHAWSSQNQIARIFAAEVCREEELSFLRAWCYTLRTEKHADLIADIEGGIKKRCPSAAPWERFAAPSAAVFTGSASTERASPMTEKFVWRC